MKKLLSAVLCSCIVLAALCTAAAADTDTAIIKTVVGDSYADVYINTENADGCTAQLGNTVCDIINTQKIGDMTSDTLILIDTSGSVPQSMRERTTELLTELIDRKQENESFAIAAFGTEAEYLCDYTDDRYELIKALERLSYDDKFTYIYSVIENEMNNFAEKTFGRIIVISDGIENSKDGITFDEVLMKLEENPCPVYTIGIENKNQESLKKFFSFSRKTHAVSTLLTEETAVSDICSIVNSYREYVCVTVEIPPEASDGSKKYLQIKNDAFTCGTDIRTNAIIPETTAATQENIIEITPTETAPITEAVPEKSSFSDRMLIIIAAAAVVIIAAVITAVTILNRKRSPAPEKNVSSDDETVTMPSGNATLIEPPVNGGTRILIPNFTAVIKLTDINAPEHSFRTAVDQGVVIGRNNASCMVVIDYDGYVSRQHCRIFMSDTELYVENLSTTKDTYVNDKPVRGKEKIKNNDIIRIGHTSLKLEIIKD